MWTGWFTPPLPASDGASSLVSSVLFSARSGAPFPLTSRHRTAVARYSRASAVRSEIASPPLNVKCGSGAQPETSSSGKKLFSSPLLFSRAVACFGPVQRSTSFRFTEVASPRKLGPVRSPQPQPRLASRARRHLPDSATCQRETRAHQRTTVPHTNRMLSLDSFARPNRSRPSRERYGTETSLFERPRLAPRRRLPHRPKNSESAIACCDAEANSDHSPNTPLSLARCRLNLKRFRRLADQPRLPFPPPTRMGEAFLKTRVPLNSEKPKPEALAPTGRGVPIC